MSDMMLTHPTFTLSALRGLSICFGSSGRALGLSSECQFDLMAPRPSGGPAAVSGVKGGPGSGGGGSGDGKKMFKMKVTCCHT
ncbi:hypothetical protein Q5P01_005364 [Channa striata]|uniref:Uncharacterized protein n=1 Tax=Channa striata TaxID=64152 RepID=A0AA88SZF0_CHASR|nr:hypothetical protein Q5P01_005364 [Channa striata]